MLPVPALRGRSAPDPLGGRRPRAPRVVAGLLLGAVLLAACAQEPTGEPAAADDQAPTGPTDAPISIGFLGELTGPFSVWGVPARNGMRLAVDDVNAAGGVDGRPLRLVERDTQGTPEEGVRALRGLVERDGVVAVGGLISSDVALAATRVAEQEQVPLLLVKAGSDAVLDGQGRFTFRTCLPAAPMTVGPLAQFVAAEGFTRVGAIVADYAWGRSIEAAVREQVGGMDGVQLQVEVAPVGETDFTTYLRRLTDLDPQLVIATGHPPGTAAITRQAAELGLPALIAGPNASKTAMFEAVGEAVYDRFVDISCADHASEEFHRLAARYHDRFGGFLEDDAVAAYGQVLMVVEALEATGGTDPVAVADHLRSHDFDLPGHAWDVSWTAWGEFDDARPVLVVLRERRPPAGLDPDAPWYPEAVLQSDPLPPYRPSSS